MLVNELATGEEILNLLADAGMDNIVLSREQASKQIGEFKKVCSKAREAWALAVFSASGKESLERYFSFHLRLLAGLSEKLSDPPGYPLPECACTPQVTIKTTFETEIHQLIGYLFQYYTDYPDKNILVPLSYQVHFVKILMPDVCLTKQALENSVLPDVLKSEIIAYLDHMVNCRASAPLTFGQLLYFQTFVKEIRTLLANSLPGNLSSLFTDKLLELEFNHLAVFTCLQEEINKAMSGFTGGEKLTWLEQKSNLMHLREKGGNERYNSRWPKLSVMLSTWLVAEINILKEINSVEHVPFVQANYKLKLELSVAHLACFLRLFVKESLPGTMQLTALFRFICDKFSTKRAETLSAGGLSKEYYSVTQVTAAEVKAMLVKMVNRINRDYFPVMAAVSIIIYAW